MYYSFSNRNHCKKRIPGNSAKKNHKLKEIFEFNSKLNWYFDNKSGIGWQFYSRIVQKTQFYLVSMKSKWREVNIS